MAIHLNKDRELQERVERLEKTLEKVVDILEEYRSDFKTQTQVIAARFWFTGRATINSVAGYLEISEKDVQAIIESDEYRENVKRLLLTTRSPANLKAYINTLDISDFSKRTHLAPDVVEELVAEVEEII